MCIIAVKKKGLPMFGEDTIRTMFRKNPDGAGLMYFDKELGKVKCKKGFMKVESLLDELKTRDFTDTNLVLHFRIGTSGLMDGLNCHPYPVYEENKTEFETDLAMAHNGILSDYNPPLGAKYNDTQNFIKLVLSKLDKNFLSNQDSVLLINELIGTNKLCFINSNDEIITMGNFVNDDGYLYSNSNYKDTYSYGTYYKSRNYTDIPLIEPYDPEEAFAYYGDLGIKQCNSKEEAEAYIEDNGLMQIDENFYVDEWDMYYDYDPETLTFTMC